MSQQFTKETHTRNIAFDAMLNTLLVREKPIRTKSYYFTPIGWAYIRKLEDIRCRRVCGDRGNFMELPGELCLCDHYREQQDPTEIKGCVALAHDPATPLLYGSPMEILSQAHKATWTGMPIGALCVEAPGLGGGCSDKAGP